MQLYLHMAKLRRMSVTKELREAVVVEVPPSKVVSEQSKCQDLKLHLLHYVVPLYHVG
jgi:hypothetical protein